MKGIEFVVNEAGRKRAVIIDLQKHGDLWEDFYDTMLAKKRKAEPRESLEEVKRKVLGPGWLQKAAQSDAALED